MIAAAFHLQDNSIAIVTDSGLAYLTPDEVKRLWRVDLVGQGKQFFLPLNMPLLRMVAVLSEVGA